MYVYHASLDRLIGPVSMSIRVDLGFRLELIVPVRLDGLTQPSDRKAALEVTKAWLAERESFVVHVIKGRRQTFDRWFAIVTDEHGSNLNEALLESGLVGPFKSGEEP